MRAQQAMLALEQIPVDFCADPDGFQSYEELVAAAGFEGSWGEIAIGALTADCQGFPEGSAVVVLSSGRLSTAVLVNCAQGAGSGAIAA